MAAEAWVLFDSAKLDLLNGAIDLDSDTFTCELISTDLAPLTSSHTVIGDFAAAICSDADYAAVNCASLSLTETNGIITWDVADISFGTSVNITARYAVIYDNTTTSDVLLCYSDLDDGGGSVTSTNGTFEIQIHADGVFTLT